MLSSVHALVGVLQAAADPGDAQVLALTRATFDQLLETEPSFARAMLREMAVRLVQARTGH